MWVTQSYLGDPDRDTKVYAYFLFEDYNREQVAFAKSIEGRLSHIGDQFGPHATILFPNEANAPRIENEVRSILGEFWHEIQGQLPGLFVSTKKLSDIDLAAGEHHYFSLARCNEAQAADVISEVHRLMYQVAQDEQNRTDKADSVPLWKRLVDAIEVKPGIFGFRVDLRRLARK